MPVVCRTECFRRSPRHRCPRWGAIAPQPQNLVVNALTVRWHKACSNEICETSASGRPGCGYVPLPRSKAPRPADTGVLIGSRADCTKRPTRNGRPGERFAMSTLIKDFDNPPRSARFGQMRFVAHSRRRRGLLPLAAARNADLRSQLPGEALTSGGH
jgi:hypothetical protein